jgi:quinol monooxygenase YgiN
MGGETIRVVARITAKPEKVAELASILRDLVGPTRKETGCISYQLLGNKTDAGDFVFVEEWTSDAALDAHLASPHLQRALSKATSLLAKTPDIRRYSLID